MEQKSGCDRLIDSFSDLKESRGGYSIQYPLNEIIFLTICSVVSGFSQWDEIADFGEEKIFWLRKHLPYENGIPSHDTINRVMGMINYRAFEECFVNWATMDIQLPKGVVINTRRPNAARPACRRPHKTPPPSARCRSSAPANLRQGFAIRPVQPATTPAPAACPRR